MKTIRIIKETDSHGVFYYIERRFWWFPFWVFHHGSVSFSLDTCQRLAAKIKANPLNKEIIEC